MSDRTELILKFVMLFSGLALFVALVYGGDEATEKGPVDKPVPSQSPTQTPSQELTPKE